MYGRGGIVFGFFFKSVIACLIGGRSGCGEGDIMCVVEGVLWVW